MSEQPSASNDRLDRLEIDMADVKVSLNRLIDFSFETDRRLRTTIEAVDRLANAQVQTLELVDRLQSQVTEMQSEVREIQSEVRGLQTENRRIWEILSDRADDTP